MEGPILKTKIEVEDGEVRRSNTSSSSTTATTTTTLYHGKSKPPKLCTHKLCSLKALLQSSNDGSPNEKKQSEMKKGTSVSGDHHVVPSFASLARLHQKFGADQQQQQQQLQKKKKRTVSTIIHTSIHPVC